MIQMFQKNLCHIENVCWKFHFINLRIVSELIISHSASSGCSSIKCHIWYLSQNNQALKCSNIISSLMCNVAGSHRFHHKLAVYLYFEKKRRSMLRQEHNYP